MKKVISGFLLALTLLVMLVWPHESAPAEEPVLPLPTVTLTLPVQTVTLSPRIVRVPKIVDGPTETIHLPRRTVTETVRPQPEAGPTETVYVYVGDTRTVTVTPTPGTARVPGPTVTRTIERPPVLSRQQPLEHGTVGKELFDLPPVSTPGAVGIGFVTLLALAGVILLAMYGGYILGYKESEREDTNFMRALRDSMLTRGKHS